MQKNSGLNVAWRALVCGIALLSLFLTASEIFYAIEPLNAGRRGSLGFGFQWGEGNRGSHQITNLNPASPLNALGARVGDTVILDNYVDDFTNLQPGQAVGLTLVQGDVATHASVKAMSMPLTSMYKVHYLTGHVERILCLVFAVLIAFKQLISKTYNSLVLYFLLLSFNYTAVFMPPGAISHIIDSIYWTTFIPYTFFLMQFAILYSGGEPTNLRRNLTRTLPAFGVLSAVFAANMAWWSTGHITLFSYYPTLIFQLLQTALILLALWHGWRSSTGRNRQRHQWLFFAFGIASFFTSLTGLPISAKFDGVSVTRLLEHIANILMQVGIAYAVLKHRIFDFGLAVNRTLVFSFTSIGLILVFFLSERFAHHYVHFESAENNAVLSGVIAFALFFVFNRLHHKVDHLVERLLFHSWHANNSALQKFVRKASHFTSSNRLLRALGEELDRYTGNAGYAVYVVDQQVRTGAFTLVEGTLNIFPEKIDVDDDIAVSLRDSRAYADLHNVAWNYAGELALPMIRGACLHGFAILGLKRNGTTYRPDEIEALAAAVVHVGMDLFALRVQQLEDEVLSLKQDAAANSASVNAALHEVESVRKALGSHGLAI